MKGISAFAFGATIIAAATGQETYTIDPSSVSNSTREQWCTSQTSECPIICNDQTSSSGTEANSCDADTLTYACICSNGLSPNVTEYSQTLPFYLCQEWGNQCVSNCGNNNTCAYDCRAYHPCGAQNPTRQNTSTLSTMSKTATASDTAASVYSGFGSSSTGAAASASAGGAPTTRLPALNVGQTFGVLALAGALFGGFAVLL